MCEYEWASVAQYLVYISGAADLSEVSSDQVVSFPLARMGADRVVARKTRLLLLLENNVTRLERFVGAYKEELNENELAVLRTLYIQYQRNIETVNAHLKVARMYRDEVDGLPIFGVKEVGDEPLF